MKVFTRTWNSFLSISLLLLVILGTGGATGCSRAYNPVATANTATAENKPETIAFALYASYVVVAEQAATVAENPQTPVAVKKTLIQLHEVASPAAKQLRYAAQQYDSVRAALATGGSTPEKVSIALAELNRVLTDAAPKLQALAQAIHPSSDTVVN